jgi:hypothetical protein
MNFSSGSTALSGINSLTTSLTNITVINSTTMPAPIPASLPATTGTLPIVIVTPTAAAQSAAGSFAVYDPTLPQVWAVDNSASYNPDVVSPGEIITIYDAGLGPQGITQFSGSSLLASLGCRSQHLRSDRRQNCPAALHQPSGLGAILNINTNVTPNDYSVHGVKNPAPAGSWVSIYATGFGVTSCMSTSSNPCVSPAPPEGQSVTGGIITPVGAVAVTIGGQAVTSPVGVVRLVR